MNNILYWLHETDQYDSDNFMKGFFLQSKNVLMYWKLSNTTLPAFIRNGKKTRRRILLNRHE